MDQETLRLREVLKVREGGEAKAATQTAMGGPKAATGAKATGEEQGPLKPRPVTRVEEHKPVKSAAAAAGNVNSEAVTTQREEVRTGGTAAAVGNHPEIVTNQSQASTVQKGKAAAGTHHG